jgi:type I restriction enzyme, R subunit
VHLTHVPHAFSTYDAPTVSNFAFLQPDFPALHTEATLAESNVHADARVACLYARRSLEGMVNWLYANDAAFSKPYDSSLNGLMGSSSFEANVPQPVRVLAHGVRVAGNNGVHSARGLRSGEALGALRDLFGVLRWFAFTYRSDPGLMLPGAFDETILPAPAASVQSSLQAAQQLEAKLKAEFETQLETQRLLSANVAAELEVELKQLRSGIAARKVVNAKAKDSYPYSEAETRVRLIDRMLTEAGWDVNAANVREYKVSAGRADYVLWGADGLPLAVIEAKKTSRDARAGQQQALEYAQALEAQFGRLPVVFYSNGVDSYLWDSARGFPPRKVQGFYDRDSLELMIQRRSTAANFADLEVNAAIVNRYYQSAAIRKFLDRLDSRQRKGLLVMATGTGKTRVTIALVELLMRANWVKRVLFLADRNALVRQAKGAFTKFYPEANAINLVDDKEVTGARVVLSTYQTMINQLEAGTFTVGHFDLVIVDEAHRSVYSKFGAIFDYFDGMLLGLTATPRDEVDRNTFRLFDLHDGVPVFEYGLELAVRDGFLVPPATRSVEAKFLREGIKYDDLSDDEKLEYDEMDWDELGGRREEIGSHELYRWLFNSDTVDKVLETLFTHGQYVSGGDVLGKTIVFAQNTAHAKFIQERFDLRFAHLGGSFAQVIAHNIERADSLIEQVTTQALPRIAISVDMLDTGIDVPEVLNLVFFKRVQSKTKFWQMLGRGTRLCPEIFGANKHKLEFHVFDFCGNFEFFNTHPKGIEGKASEPLEQRLFKLRCDVLQALAPNRDDEATLELYAIHADFLHERICAMPENHFMVRPHLELIERFGVRENWEELTRLNVKDIKDKLSSLPSAIVDADENAKRFDALVFQASLGILEGSPRSGVQSRIEALAASLERKANVPQVKANLNLIRNLQTPEFWAETTATNLETVRTRLRDLMNLIDRENRIPHLETNFEDSFGAPELMALNGLGFSTDREAYHKKVEAFIHANLSHPVVQKLRQAQPLTQSDLRNLEQLLFTARELESRETFEFMYGKDANLGVFIRGLIGLDRAAAKREFGKYLDGKNFSSDQVQFVNFIIDALTENGVMDKNALFDSPFTDVHTQGIAGLFTGDQVSEILEKLEFINAASLSNPSGRAAGL